MSDAGRLIKVDGPRLGHIPAFDGFRGLFVLQVVLYHALVTDFLEGSPIIIDWFFVASRVANDGGARDVLWVPGENR